MLQFDAATREFLDICYRGEDITRRRMENMRSLAPAPGEAILDLGCGQGLMTRELARAVGPAGQVIGVDPSADMRDGATALCTGLSQVQVLQGGGADIPLDDAAMDGAVSLQVFEYIPDIPAVLAELRRVLRPGGRLVIGDMQWDTLSWASDAPDRMRRMCRAWEAHVAETAVPALLPAALSAAGFQITEMRPLPFAAITLRPDGLPFMMLHLMRDYAIANALVPQPEADAWFGEQFDRAEEGRFFFSLTHFIVAAIRLPN